MAAEEPTVTATPAVEKKKRKWLIPAIVGALVLAGGVSGYVLIVRGNDAGTTATAKAKDLGPAQYYTLDPTIVVNFQDERAIRFLQVGVSLMSHDPEAITAAKAAEPRIRNALVILFSSQSYGELGTTKGKLALQQQALVKVQEVVKQSLGRPGIEAVYFTSFVMQ